MPADIAEQQPGYGLDAKGVGGVFSIDALDKRTRPYRRYVAICGAVISDMGGEANITEVQRQLVSKFATLALQLEVLESAALEGEQIDVDLFGRNAGHLRRLAEVLGLTRVARNVPTLAEYLKSKTEIEAAE